MLGPGLGAARQLCFEVGVAHMRDLRRGGPRCDLCLFDSFFFLGLAHSFLERLSRLAQRFSKLRQPCRAEKEKQGQNDQQNLGCSKSTHKYLPKMLMLTAHRISEM